MGGEGGRNRNRDEWGREQRGDGWRREGGLDGVGIDEVEGGRVRQREGGGGWKVKWTDI